MAKMKQRNDINCVMTVKGLVCENTWIYTTGRIKRMRSRRKSRYVRLDKRLGKRANQLSCMDFFYPITRWTRH